MAYGQRLQTKDTLVFSNATLTASTPIMAANPNRVGLSVQAQGAPVFVGFTSPCTALNAVVKIPADGYWECPMNWVGDVFAFAPVATSITAVEYR